MRKFTAFLLAFLMVLGCAACGNKQNDTPAPTATSAPTAAPTEAPDAAPTEAPAVTQGPDEEIDPGMSVTPETPKAMSYAEYAAAAIDDEVVIEAYVQAKQSWWQDTATVYLQDEEGAYFAYNMACSETDYAKLTQGTKIRVTGYKAEWSGEVEIVDATFEIIDGNYVATATDVTDLLANEAELIKKQNMFVAFKGMTVESAAIYKWDGSGQDGDDLYFNVSKDGNTYSFTVESYLCDNTTEVYQTVKNLKVGDVVDMEGFLYWYEGVNPHITSVTVLEAANTAEKTEGVMSYAEYAAAAIDDEVVIEAYVQAKQSWWQDTATVYLQDEDGAYFAYNMACSEEDYAKLTQGTKIRVKGYKAEWAGEVEIVDATFEIIDGNYVAEATDVTALLGTDALAEKQNMFVAFKGMTVESAAIYKWDGSGQDGDDLYFNVSVNGNTYTFTVESYLCGNDTEVYQAVKNLKVGDVVDMEGFLYWYEGVNPHITSVAPAGEVVVNDNDVKSEGVMTYAEYAAAALDTEVVIEAYVQAKQSWWQDTATVYLQDADGAYFAYNMACTEEDYAKIPTGTKIRVTGYKAEWSGEVEIVDATFEILEGNYVAEATDVTALLANEAELIKKQNMFVAFKGMTVESAAIYKWDGSGQDGDDLYFNVSLNGNTYTFTVESYLCGNDTEVYQAVKNLKVGDVVDMEGFLYWYEGVNPHITGVTVK